MSAADRSAHPVRPARRDGWWRTAPVVSIAVLALLVSTAGGAYAVGKNSIGTKQLKNNAVTSGKIKNSTVQSADIKDGSVGAADLAPGTIPVIPAPAPAPPSRTYFVTTDPEGTILGRSAGVESVTRSAFSGASIYSVALSFDPTRCAAVATSGSAYATVGVFKGPTKVDVYLSYKEGAVYSAVSLTITC